MSPLGAAGSLGAGAAGAGAGGGGGGAGSSFLPHPPKVRVKAKRAAPDNKTILFPILNSPPFPSQKPFLLVPFITQVSPELQAISACGHGKVIWRKTILAFVFAKTSAASSLSDRIDTRLDPS
jgi:hypothetical protein